LAGGGFLRGVSGGGGHTPHPQKKPSKPGEWRASKRAFCLRLGQLRVKGKGGKASRKIKGKTNAVQHYRQLRMHSIAAA